jgi:hypothetical protein
VSAGRSTGRALVAMTVALVATKLSVAGCSDVGSYIYSGEQYDPVLQCLEPVSSIDIIAGNAPGSCNPVCILSLPEDGGQIAYVSTMCPPYPVYPYESDASTDPLCVAALEAFARDALCEDGGVVLPPSEDSGVDAGVDADAGVQDSGEPITDATGNDATENDATGSDATADATQPIDAANDAPAD